MGIETKFQVDWKELIPVWGVGRIFHNLSKDEIDKPIGSVTRQDRDFAYLVSSFYHATVSFYPLYKALEQIYVQLHKHF